MEDFYAQLPLVLFIGVVAVGVAVLWRTCIYTRGGIFRPIGRLLDYWVYLGCLPNSTWWHKTLRFIAYPLGRCIYCSSFHFAYEVFFIMVFLFDFPLSLKWLFVLLPVNHLFVIMFMKWFVNTNSDMVRGDWGYMKENTRTFIDTPQRFHTYEVTPEYKKHMEECEKGSFRG